jgi:UDP-N-acetyl-D-galactosamine dehydrogenase
MVPKSVTRKTVCVVGLGYVGYPLAEAFSMHIRTIGFRRNKKAVEELNRTPGNRIEATTDPAKIKEADFVIIAVPTPVTKAKDPDLKPVISASEVVGKNLKKGAIVILESTVYPGVTEDIMVPILERESGMKCGRDFFIGYSPERTNPGDNEHILKNITKIVAGMDKKTLDTLKVPIPAKPQRDLYPTRASGKIRHIINDMKYYSTRKTIGIIRNKISTCRTREGW